MRDKIIKYINDMLSAKDIDTNTISAWEVGKLADKIIEIFSKEECVACNGNGRVSDNGSIIWTRKCETCNGTGKSPEPIKQLKCRCPICGDPHTKLKEEL